MLAEIILGLAVSYLVLFALSVVLKDNSIADIFWGLGFLQVFIHSFILLDSWQGLNIILGILIVVWSLRISLYILSKKILKPGEDSRYADWRKTWKHFYIRSLFQVYLLQGVLLLVIATPLLIINTAPASMTAFTIVGVIIAATGLIIETIADAQLRSFIKKRTGNIMTKGLWYYSRHPNYFGESVFWLGISLMAFPLAWYALVSWLLITFLLRFVSGVPLAERRYTNDANYQLYKKTTPAMVPNFFKKS